MLTTTNDYLGANLQETKALRDDIKALGAAIIDRLDAILEAVKEANEQTQTTKSMQLKAVRR